MRHPEQPSSQRQTAERQLPGVRERVERRADVQRAQGQFLPDEHVLETACTTMCIYLLPLNSTLKTVNTGTSQAVQRLRLRLLTQGLIPGQQAKTPHRPHGQKTKT